MAERNSWDYLLSIESDLIGTLDYVELTEFNANVYSNQFAKILLLAACEVESVAKLLAGRITDQDQAGGIKRWGKAITEAYPDFYAAEVTIVRTGAVVSPWAAWKIAGTAPDWWIAYNNVKHDRVSNFTYATQANAVSAVAALLVVNVYHYQAYLEPYTQLFDCGYPDRVVTSGNFKFPGL